MSVFLIPETTAVLPTFPVLLGFRAVCASLPRLHTEQQLLCSKKLIQDVPQTSGLTLQSAAYDQLKEKGRQEACQTADTRAPRQSSAGLGCT